MTVDGNKKPGNESGLSRFGKRFGELFLTLLLVVLCFAGFFSLLNSVFPTGTSLRQLISGQTSGTNAGESAEGARRQMQSDAKTGGSDTLAAVLSETRNEVKSKSASSIAWGPARSGMKLYNRDAVQTIGNSQARISFGADNYLNVGSNSLVIIKRMESDPFVKQQRSFMVMVEGELSGRIAAETGAGLQVEISTPDAVARILGTEGADARFKLSVLPDQSSSIVVYEGSAEISSQGKTVRVDANEGLTFRAGEDLDEPVSLPDPPQLQTPADRSATRFRNLPPRVRFSWATVAEAAKYRFILAKDPEFKTIVVNEVVSKAEFVHGSLGQGTYYWRVSTLREGCEGQPGVGWKWEMIQDLEPPQLQVSYPEEVIGQERFTLRGNTEPGCKVFVDGREAPVDGAGRFAFDVDLRPGLNSLLVEAVDAAGNIAYQGGMIQKKL